MTWRPRFSLRTLIIFTLLATSGMGLWWRWQPWRLILRLADACPRGEYREWLGRHPKLGSEPRLCFEFSGYRTREDFRPASDWRHDERNLQERMHGVHIVVTDGAVYMKEWRRAALLLDATFGPGASVGPELAEHHLIDFLAYSERHRTAVLYDGPSKALWVLRRLRPQGWRGVFWLWEFWLTAFFAGLLLWGLYRDRKYFRSLAAKQAEASP